MKKHIVIVLSTLLLLVGCTQPPSSPPTSTPTPARTTAAAPATPATPGSATPASPKEGTGTPAADGEDVVNQEVGLRYKIPAGWKKVKPDGSVISSADESLVAVLLQPDEDDLQAVLKNLSKELEKVIKEPKIEHEATEHNINGISSYTLSGTGKLDGKEAEWSVEILKVKKALIVVEFAEKGAYEKNQATVDTWENSFEALEGGATPGGASTPTPGSTEE